MNVFNYENKETVIQQGGKMIRAVSIKQGKGYKSITKYHKGKKLYTVKKPIHKSDIELIKKGKFIPGLFKDCKNCKTKRRKGGNNDTEDNNDIEMGPEIPPIESYPVPPHPDRFKRYDKLMRSRPSSPEEVSAVFSGPTPEEREAMERKEMFLEDPKDVNPFNQELQIFSRGGRTSRRRRTGN
jgi:hypothetical protein